MLVTLHVDDMKVTSHNFTYNWLALTCWSHGEMQHTTRLYFKEIATLDTLIAELQSLRDNFVTGKGDNNA